MDSKQPGACAPACVHLMEAAMLSARLVEVEGQAEKLARALRQVVIEYRSFLVSDYETRSDPGAGAKISRTGIPQAERLLRKIDRDARRRTR